MRSGDERLELALRLSEGLKPTPRNLERVAAATDRETARSAFSQWELRERAKAKFGAAQKMLFVREALEQATHERIAAYHASRFPKGALVVDLTTGVGGDLLALAARGPVVGYETDQERADCARYNLQALGLEGIVVEEDGVAAVWDAQYAFADPSRRVDGRRTLDVVDFHPPLAPLISRLRGLRLTCVKLSPLLDDGLLESFGGSLEFVSYGGECREALIWLGTDAIPGRSAVHVSSGEMLPASPTPSETEMPSEWLFEADPAAIRAHALGTLCARYGLSPLGRSNGFLTGPQVVESPWLRSWHVLDALPFDRKRLRAWLRTHDSTVFEVKTRGVKIDPERTLREIRTPGTRRLTLAIYSSDRQVLAVFLLPNRIDAKGP